MALNLNKKIDKNQEGDQQNHATSGDRKKIQQPLMTKKITQPLGIKKSRNLSGQKKIQQPLGTKKNHATS